MSFSCNPFCLGPCRTTTTTSTSNVTTTTDAFEVSWCDGKNCITYLVNDSADWIMLPSLLVTDDTYMVVRRSGAGRTSHTPEESP